jgi:hypothetical protein
MVSDDCTTCHTIMLTKLHGCAVSCCCCHCLQHKPPPPGGPGKSAGMSKAVRHALDSLGLIFARLPAQVGGFLASPVLGYALAATALRPHAGRAIPFHGGGSAAVRQGCLHGSWESCLVSLHAKLLAALLAAHAWPALVRST